MDNFKMTNTLYREWEMSDGSIISFQFTTSDKEEWGYFLVNSYELVKQQTGGFLPKGKELPERIYYETKGKCFE
jgi:hypothetical protein